MSRGAQEEADKEEEVWGLKRKRSIWERGYSREKSLRRPVALKTKDAQFLACFRKKRRGMLVLKRSIDSSKNQEDHDH
jgi:hypothetical protein